MSAPVTGYYRFARLVFNILFTGWMDVTVTGTENLPTDKGFLLACNHVSNVDPVAQLLAAMNANVALRIMAKKSLFSVPIVGFSMKQMRMIPVDRAAKDPGAVLEPTRQALRGGECVAIYPEGTLTRDPDLWPMHMKTGAARLALDTQVPVIPMAMWGTHSVLPRYTTAFNMRPRQRVNVVIGPEVPLTDLYSDEHSNDHQAVDTATLRIWESITHLVAHLRGEVAPAAPTAEELLLDPETEKAKNREAKKNRR